MAEVKTRTVLKMASEQSNSANHKALANVKARVIEIKKGTADIPESGEPAPGMSKKIPHDPVLALMHKGEVIEPPFDMLTLAMLVEHSTELGQCVESMETNIDSFGHRLVPRVRLDDVNVKVPESIAKEVRQERVKLTNFFQYATGDDSFVAFRRKLRRDFETTGNTYFEVIRNAAGSIQSFAHIPSYQINLSRVDDEAVLVDRPVLELQTDGSVKVVMMKEWRRFRRFVQSRTVQMRTLSTVYNYKMRWFKTLGDPRIYNNETGERADEKLAPEKRANEVVHLALYSARTPYGLPRYIGNLLSIFGDRAAEEINFITFRNNNIPSMVVLVSNGQLTEGTIARIESFVESQIQGSDNYSKFLILEAEGELEGEDGSQVKMDIKPLVKEQHKDALFQNYSSNNQDKIRRAFRLPPIFVGRSEDYTRATAESSRKLADEQIFAPERDEFDELMNRIIFPQMGIVYHKFKSNSPNTTDNAELTKILAGSEKTGGMTPRIARSILEDILSRDMGTFSVGFPADIPFSLTMAEAVKNLAQPSEPGQQVTALKMFMGGEPDDEATLIDATCKNCGHDQMVHAIEKSDDPVVDYLVKLNKRIERKWQADVKKANEVEPQLWPEGEGNQGEE